MRKTEHHDHLSRVTAVFGKACHCSTFDSLLQTQLMKTMCLTPLSVDINILQSSSSDVIGTMLFLDTILGMPERCSNAGYRPELLFQSNGPSRLFREELVARRQHGDAVSDIDRNQSCRLNEQFTQTRERDYHLCMDFGAGAIGNGIRES